jgi:hypothetical protein
MRAQDVILRIANKTSATLKMMTTDEKFRCPAIPAMSMKEMAVSNTPNEIGIMPEDVL